MPDEYDFKNYKSIDEFSKTIEGTKYLHELYLKAISNPIRREILFIIKKNKKILKNTLLEILINEKIINDEFSFKYNIDYLIKAFCVNEIEENNEIYYEITQSGRIIDYLK
ncbi:MAG: hypothetical protein JXA99_08660 [Candidatus Lokiarchaeota archaeon]|nr:hypothetical protein [Candidatus Lokiarchaeota archaeon]